MNPFSDLFEPRKVSHSKKNGNPPSRYEQFSGNPIPIATVCLGPGFDLANVFINIAIARLVGRTPVCVFGTYSPLFCCRAAKPVV